MILGYSIYEILEMFFVYAFLGWCVEVIYCGLEEGRFINRGFLNGPLCPIYGIGAVTVILCLTSVSDNLLLLFICSAALTSMLELITGFALDKIFHARWWDYSYMPFNIGGYICLKFSVYWGLVCIALMRFIHPAIINLIRFVPDVFGIVLLTIFSLVFAADIVITVVTVNNLVRRIKLMDDIAERIHLVSDKIGGSVYGGAVKARDKGIEILNSDKAVEIREKYDDNVEEIKRKQTELKERYEKEIAELKEKYAEMVKERNVFQRRILRAFPDMKSRFHNEHLEKLKEKFKPENKMEDK